MPKFFLNYTFGKSQKQGPDTFMGSIFRSLINPLVRAGYEQTQVAARADFFVWGPSMGCFPNYREQDLLFLERREQDKKPVLVADGSGYSVQCGKGAIDRKNLQFIGTWNAFYMEGNTMPYWNPEDTRPPQEERPEVPLPKENTCVHLAFRRSTKEGLLKRLLNEQDTLIGGGWNPSIFKFNTQVRTVPYNGVVRELVNYRYVLHITEELYSSQGLLCYRIDEAFRSNRVVFACASNKVHKDVVPAFCLFETKEELDRKREELMDPDRYDEVLQSFKTKYMNWCTAHQFDPKLASQKLSQAGLEVC